MVGSLTERAHRRIASIIIALFVALLVPDSESYAATYDLLVSAQPDRSSPSNLEGATITGNVYIFISPESGINSVKFHLDDPSAGGTPVRSESQAPFDFAGGNTNTASPFDSDQLSQGAHSVTAVLSLSAGGSETITAYFNVSYNGNGGGGNSPPEIIPIGDKSVEEGQTLTFVVTANDSDGGSPELSASNLPSGNGADASFTDNGDGTGTFRWTTTVGDEDSYNTTITATDASDSSLSDGETIQITVDAQSAGGGGNSNYDLEFSVSPDRSNPSDLNTATVNGDIYVFVTPESDIQRVQFYLDDPNTGGTPVQSESQAPFDLAGGSANSANPFDSDQLSEGSHSMTAVITLSSGGSETITANFTVSQNGNGGGGNTPPVLNPIGDKSVEEGQTLTFTVTANDSDGGSPELSASNLPSGNGADASFTDNGDGTGTFRWTTTVGDEGSYNTTITATDASDSSLSDSETIQITVDAQSAGGGGNSNYDLEFSVSPDRSNPSDLDTATVNGDIYVFVTPESDIQRVQFYLDDPNTGGTPVQSESQAPFDLAGGSANSANPFDSDQLSEGSHSVTAVLTLSSGGSETITAYFNVSYNGSGGGNTPPVLNPIGDKSVEEGQTLTFTVTANDSDGGSPELSASNLPSGNGADASFTDNGDGTGTFRWTTTVGDEGSYNTTITATDASDSSLSDGETIQITVDAQSAGGGGGSGTLELRVSNSSDDAEESASGGVKRGSSDLELTKESSNQTVGLRFQGLDIPRGVTIRDAYLQFKADESHSGSTSLKIQGQASNNVNTFSSAKNNVSSRPRTQASINWSPAPWATGQAGANQRTPNIASVVQEIVNRSGWSSGNSIALIITGTGKRVAESYNGDQAAAPLLHVEYDDDESSSVATPIINPNGGTFSTSVDITLSSATSGALIYYTLNGSDPDVSSTLYSSSFALTTSATLKAIGILNNTESSVASSTFTVTQIGNSPPALSNVGDKSVEEGQILIFTVQATDLDTGAPPELSANNLPSGNAADATFTDNGNGTGTFRWTTAVGDAGSYNVTFTATDALDSSLSDNETIKISVLTPSSALPRTFPGAHWESRQPIQLGVDGNRLDQFASNVGGQGLIVKDGYIVKSWGDPSTKSDWASATKPVLGTLLFFAVDEARVNSVDDLISNWGWNLSTKDRTMTFHHLANMTSGYARGESPGTAWAYNDIAINLYGETLERVFGGGQTLDDIALDRMAELEFEDGSIFGSRGGYGVHASVRDFARIAWLWLNKGNWKGQQLIPRSHFDNYMKPGVPSNLPRSSSGGSDYLGVGSFGGDSNQNPPASFGPGIYGFNWWFNGKVGTSNTLHWPDAPADTFQANGHWGFEVVTVIPSLNMVVAALGNWGGFDPGSASSGMNQNLKLLSDAVP